MNILKRQYWENNLWHSENGRDRRKYYRLTDRGFMSALSVPDAFRVWGVDVSHWNIPPVDFQRMKDVYGLSFAIIKGCDGSINSRYYEENKAAAKAAGVPWGMYVWLYRNINVSIDAQVNAWYARYIADPPPLGVFIDAEWTTYGGLPANPSSADLRMAHDKWRAKSGVKATTYTAAGYANTYLASFDWSKEELWIANYDVARPLLPVGADGYTWWQFSSTLDGKALDPEGNAELDGNYFSGDHYQFAARFLTNGETEQPMEHYFSLIPSVAGEWRSVRNETAYPGTPHIYGGTTTTQRILAGKTAKAAPGSFYVYDADVWVNGEQRAAIGDKWWKIYEANGAPMVGWVAEIHLGRRWLNVAEINPPPAEPEPVAYPAYVMLHYADGTSRKYLPE